MYWKTELFWFSPDMLFLRQINCDIPRPTESLSTNSTGSVFGGLFLFYMIQVALPYCDKQLFLGFFCMTHLHTSTIITRMFSFSLNKHLWSYARVVCINIMCVCGCVSVSGTESSAAHPSISFASVYFCAWIQTTQAGPDSHHHDNRATKQPIKALRAPFCTLIGFPACSLLWNAHL